MSTLFVLLAAVYAVLTIVRFAAAFVWLRRPAPAVGRAGDVTVMQPILSGDPALEGCLRANLAAAPDASFLLLIDEDDATAQDIATRLDTKNARVLIGPPPQAGENPKSVKLARGFAHVSTPLFAVLDDDTILPGHGLAAAAGCLTRGNLVTGLPTYVREGNLWSRLLAAFVNGSALITYPCADLFGQQRTINGMFYLGRTEELRALGGFDAIRGELTDDYAMAKLYLQAGKTIVQSAIVHPIVTTVADRPHYLSIMRRWMIFAMRYVQENRSLFTLGVIGLPTLCPPLMILVGAFVGVWHVAAALALFAAKGVAMAALRKPYVNDKFNAASLGLEILSDVITPFHLGAALVRPQSFRWRSRTVLMKGDQITYE